VWRKQFLEQDYFITSSTITDSMQCADRGEKFGSRGLKKAAAIQALLGGQRGFILLLHAATRKKSSQN